MVERRFTQGAATGVNWCPQWWKHPEAISRLHALWRAGETLRVAEDTGMSVWWRDHLDPEIAVLTGEYGRSAGAHPTAATSTRRRCRSNRLRPTCP
ncbi:DUF4913 domain-containing protein [Couchioplanes azureus]|uniref:DUF4913 domain-containing protein n=1 Tax=Couchioplanes caeruleus TaxID=56438 RepID=UPI001995E263|nr:DUF4913 domain-containing protein [Couchioplanes caeruleus]GGQ84746.1 hypothetical protein GCM10010166_63710 [Couchioplanes caeruleus subsp. azureus]